MWSIAWYFFYFVLFNKFNVIIFNIIWLNKKLILINKFSKHNQVNISSCKIKCIDLYLFLIFFLIIVNDFFFCLLIHVILNLFNNMNAWIF